MAKIPNSSPQQLELRVFADVNSNSDTHKNALAASSSPCQQRESNQVDEASPEDRAVYRAIADRYFAS